MARKVTPMAGKVLAAVVAVAEGGELNVAAVCRSGGISRETFYRWVRRYKAEGLDGFAERSRRPRSSPNQISPEVEDEVVRLRKSLSDDGLDHGATTIQWHLGQDPFWRGRVPSVAGVHRVLTRRGLVVAQPGKRPKSSWCRFEASAPNERWQIDATEWTIASGKVAIFNIIDDHSRLAVASRAVAHATGEQAWTTFSVGAQQWGLPSEVLSDNGLCFSGKLRGFEVLFEARLRDAGIRPFTGRAYHPQTTGKVERFQQTLKKWLRRQPLTRTLDEFQAQLDAFCHRYPISRW
jgi:transposase InsO family protein